jgi:hypothetical protein
MRQIAYQVHLTRKETKTATSSNEYQLFNRLYPFAKDEVVNLALFVRCMLTRYC